VAEQEPATATSGKEPSPGSRSVADLIVTNSSLIAILVYMGWAYESAVYGYFHLSPIDLGAGIPEYLLRCLNLFNPLIVIAAVAIIAVLAASDRIAGLATAVAPRARAAVAPPARKAVRHLAGTAAGRAAGRLPGTQWLRQLLALAMPRASRLWRSPRAAQAALGTVLTLAALILAGVAGYVRVSTYLLLIMLATGPLLLTRPRRQHSSGRLPRVLAVIVAVVAALWAGSLYASSRGTQDAQALAANLQSRTAVAVYSVQDLAITDPGVTVQKLPPGYQYHYRYLGLRLLTMRSGTYYLLPLDWTPRLGVTYILDDTDQIRIELYLAS
jgi:hypothetical protein